MKKSDLDAYDKFFLEIPTADYLTDIEIQDDHEKTPDDLNRGLSDEQVSQIAIDSLGDSVPEPEINLESSPGTETKT